MADSAKPTGASWPTTLWEARGNEVKDMDLGLTRIRTVLDSCHDPHLDYAVVHVAGTNGKGSVCAMAESILRSAGWKTGLFTSPHLQHLRERIRIDGSTIGPSELEALAGRIEKTEQRLLATRALNRRLTFFELITCCAFLHFSRSRIDIAVVEVGMGGRLDATNVVCPNVCVITNVSRDHQNYLGDSLTKIAREKVGILKPGVKVISGCSDVKTRKILLEEARRLRSSVLEVHRDCKIEMNGQATDLETPSGTYGDLRLPMPGEHQAVNAALAVCAVEEIKGFPVSKEAIYQGLPATSWPGRLDEYWFPRHTILDGAHNAAAAGSLRDYLKRRRFREVHLVFGTMSDKDFGEMGRLLFPTAVKIHLAPIENERSAHPRDVAASQPLLRSKMAFYRTAISALQSAWKQCPSDGTVVVAGSLYLLGEILSFIEEGTNGQMSNC